MKYRSPRPHQIQIDIAEGLNPDDDDTPQEAAQAALMTVGIEMGSYTSLTPEEQSYVDLRLSLLSPTERRRQTISHRAYQAADAVRALGDTTPAFADSLHEPIEELLAALAAYADADPLSPGSSERIANIEAAIDVLQQTAERLRQLQHDGTQSLTLPFSSDPFITAPHPAKPDQSVSYARVQSNLITEAVTQALSRHHEMSDSKGRALPTYTMPVNKGRGRIEVIANPSHDNVVMEQPTADMIAAAWEWVSSKPTPLISDAYLLWIAKWTAQCQGRPDAGVWLKPSDLLQARHTKPVMKKDGYAHGYHSEQIRDARDAILALKDIYIRAVSVRLQGKGRKAEILDIECSLCHIEHRARQRLLPGMRAESEIAGVYIVPGQWARAYQSADLLQVGCLARAALEYDPYHESREKALAKQLFFDFRRNRGKKSPPPRIVATLMEWTGETPQALAQEKHPQRVKDGLESALNRLAADGVIARWTYAPNNPPLPPRKWLPTWLTWRVYLHPPAYATQRYENELPIIAGQLVALPRSSL